MKTGMIGAAVIAAFVAALQAVPAGAAAPGTADGGPGPTATESTGRISDLSPDEKRRIARVRARAGRTGVRADDATAHGAAATPSPRPIEALDRPGRPVPVPATSRRRDARERRVAAKIAATRGDDLTTAATENADGGAVRRRAAPTRPGPGSAGMGAPSARTIEIVDDVERLRSGRVRRHRRIRIYAASEDPTSLRPEEPDATWIWLDGGPRAGR